MTTQQIDKDELDFTEIESEGPTPDHLKEAKGFQPGKTLPRLRASLLKQGLESLIPAEESTSSKNVSVLAFMNYPQIIKKLNVLSQEEYDFLETKDPDGIYDRESRETLFLVLAKLTQFKNECTWTERRLLKKYGRANFGFLIGPDTQANGRLSFNGPVRVEGSLEGELRIDDALVIGEGGEVKGKIFAQSVVCQGRITGNVYAEKKVEIQDGGRILGDVRTPAMEIAVGGRLEGNCLMTPEPKNKNTIHKTPKPSIPA